jgi:solute carrier family 25 carnitine/acylcarnitine transporter 20/29
MDKFVIDYVAGVAGGIAVVLVGHPFDTTKTRLQNSPHGYYKDTLDCLRQTVEREGVVGFYSGMLSPLVGQMVRY